ncbi:MAG: protein-L-isoaspartate O-methyltransferase [Patescibacteria group bacterium]
MPLIDSLISEGWLKTPRIIEAFRKIKREDFLPVGMQDAAEFNGALPIGFGQTISQPLTVAFMLEKLEPKEGENILDVGSGSGWTTALLSEIAGKNALPAGRQGKVTAMEIIPELKELGEKNTAKYGFIENGVAEFICGDGSKGYDKNAPYDKILVSASAGKLPGALKEQLKVGGKIVIPVKESIWVFRKTAENFFEEQEYPGFLFVPLV